MNSEPWHAIVCYSGHEQRIFDKMIAAAKPVFWPRWLLDVRRHGSSTIRQITRSLAPGYLFVIFDASNPSTWHEVRNICGQSFVSFIGNDTPVAVPDKAFDYLREEFSAGPDGLMREPKETVNLGIFKMNEEVVLTSPIEGFLFGQVGKVLWSSSNGTRASFRIFGRETTIFVPPGTGLLRLATNADHGISDRRSMPQYKRRVNAKFSSLQPLVERV